MHVLGRVFGPDREMDRHLVSLPERLPPPGFYFLSFQKAVPS